MRKPKGQLELIVVPGGFEDAKYKRYNELKDFCKKNNIVLYFAPIKRKYHTFTSRQKQFLERYKKHSFNNPIVLGFSWGAMIAVATAHAIKAKKLILCSLSPFWAEDLFTVCKPSRIRDIGPRRLTDFSQYIFTKIPLFKDPTTIIYGGDELHSVIQRCEKAHKHIKQSELIIMPDKKHDLPSRDLLKKLIN